MQLEPVDFDPFAQPAPQGGGPLRITVTPGQQQPRLEPVDHDPFAPTGVGSDVLNAIPSGIAKGAIDLVGLPDTISQIWASAGDKLLDVVESVAGLPAGWAADIKKYINMGRQHGAMAGLPSSRDIRRGVESVTGPLYEPKTVPGQYAGTTAEFASGAIAGPGGLARRALTQVALPGVASETAGQMTKGTAYEPYARGAGAVLGGVAGIPFSSPRTADQVIRKNMGAIDDATVQRATALMDDAAARNIQLTWAEALEQVAPGTGLVNLQRTVESLPEGRAVLAPVIAQRPGQIDAAGRQVFDTVAPVNPNPSGIGPAAGVAAEGVVNDARGLINQASDPFYRAASRVRLQPQEFARAQALPGYQQARHAVLSDPQLARYVQGLPEDSVGFLNEIKKQMDAARAGAASPLNTNPNMQVPAGWGMDAEAARGIGVDASRRVPGNPYETALNIQSSLREQYLEPALRGPLGNLAKNDITTRKAIDAVFPANPLPNSEQEIASAIRALSNRNPAATRDLLRAYAESVFNEATKNIQSGPSAYGGSNFAKALSGQNRANLRAAVENSGPGGREIWQGFERFLEIAEATGKRMREGSPTAGRAQEIKDMSTGGMVANATKFGTNPSKWLSPIADAWSRWQLGGNVGEIARLLADQGARNRMRALANAPQGSDRGLILTGQLAGMFAQGALDGGKAPQAPR